MNKTSNKYHVILIYLVLALGTFVAFVNVRHNEFVYDDGQYIIDNPHVNGGITRESILWAFTTSYACNWHPLTWLSHMLDCQLFGTEPSWHHLTGLLLHIVNTLLLFSVLRRMTGAVFRSAFVAAVFAVHPIHVESVAWVAERKDVLSTLFWMLTIAAYLRYVKRPCISRYLLIVLTFALGLMSKPMIITLPLVLLLLDYWPLERIQLGQADRQLNGNTRSQWAVLCRLTLEKVPLFALSAVSCVVTFIAQRSGGAVMFVPLRVRAANVLVSYISYISKMIYPSRLAVFYPYPRDGLSAWQPIVSVAVLVGITISVIYLARRRRPYLAVGWLWYLVTLVPVIGLIQAGSQGMADRYTYIPSIGFFIIVSWGVSELLARWRYRKIGLGIIAGAVLAALLICTRLQVRYWQNNFTLFGRAFMVTKSNPIMLYNLGREFQSLGKLDEAVACYTEAIQFNPGYADAHNNLGTALKTQGKPNEAISHFRQALQSKPSHADAHHNLGTMLSEQGGLDQAISHYRQALQFKPDFADAHNSLGVALSVQGKPDEAISHFHQALQLRPNFAQAHNNLGYALKLQGNLNEAVSHYRKALQTDPNYLAPLNGMAWILATHPDPNSRDVEQAIELAERAAELTGHQNATILGTLSAAYAAAGKFPAAIETAEKALEIAQSSEQKELIENCLRLFKAGRSYCEPQP